MTEIIHAFKDLFAMGIGLISVLLLALLLIFFGALWWKHQFPHSKEEAPDSRWRKVIGKVLMGIGKELIRPPASKVLGITAGEKNPVGKHE